MERQAALNLLNTFHSTFYHEAGDVRGTTRALQVLADAPQYRRDLAHAFKLVLETDLPAGTLTKLVREGANRNVTTDKEARSYLEFIYKETLLDVELDLEG